MCEMPVPQPKVHATLALLVYSGGHMSPPQPLGLAEEDEVHPALDGGPPSAGVGRRSGPSAPAHKGRVRHHQPLLKNYSLRMILV
jgi:hypothetical protein